jgi:hypothetical protein
VSVTLARRPLTYGSLVVDPSLSTRSLTEISAMVTIIVLARRGGGGRAAEMVREYGSCVSEPRERKLQRHDRAELVLPRVWVATNLGTVCDAAAAAATASTHTVGTLVSPDQSNARSQCDGSGYDVCVCGGLLSDTVLQCCCQADRQDSIRVNPTNLKLAKLPP